MYVCVGVRAWAFSQCSSVDMTLIQCLRGKTGLNWDMVRACVCSCAYGCVYFLSNGTIANVVRGLNLQFQINKFGKQS